MNSYNITTGNLITNDGTLTIYDTSEEVGSIKTARAIVNNPPLLICDEPTGNLDPARSLEIVKLIEEINKKVGTTVLMVTHDEVIVNKMKKHVIALKDGHLFKDYKKGEYINEVL